MANLSCNMRPADTLLTRQTEIFTLPCGTSLQATLITKIGCNFLKFDKLNKAKKPPFFFSYQERTV